MDVFKNYKNYRQFKPEYPQWKEDTDYKEAQRQEYLKRHPEAINQQDIQRGKALLHAIDIMDEYSQKNAEDMEIATEMAASQALSMVQIAGTMIGMAATAIPSVQRALNKIGNKSGKYSAAIAFLPTAIGYIGSIFASFPLMAWAAKAQVSASRKGRFEAMRTDLKNPNNFAVLTDEQMKEAEKEAKNITLEEETKKKPLINTGFKESFKTLKKLAKKDRVYEQQKAEFEKTIGENQKHFDEKLSQTDVNKAKRDQQLLVNLVHKVDIASQDYAENVEMATNFASAAAIGSGFLTGWVTNKILKLCKLNPSTKAARFIPIGVGIALPLVVSVYSAKIQKQASRVGRFNVKREMAKNPNNLVYIEEEKSSQIRDFEPPKPEKKPNIFKFLIQAFKDNKEYNQYMQTEGLQNKKLHKAMEKLKLEEKQLKEAKALQHNTFKTFNKVDEKSQTYAESIEALGQSLQFPIALVGMLAGTGLAMLVAKKDLTKVFKLPEAERLQKLPSIIAKYVGLFLTGLLPTFALEAYITKEQKKASRIADMLAIKELSDYRHYVDYNNREKDSDTEVNLEKAVVTKSNSLLDMMMKK